MAKMPVLPRLIDIVATESRGREIMEKNLTTTTNVRAETLSGKPTTLPIIDKSTSRQLALEPTRLFHCFGGSAFEVSNDESRRSGLTHGHAISCRPSGWVH